jgi:hypothetical protein
VRDVIRALFDLSKSEKHVTAVRLMNHFENNEDASDLISEAAHVSETLDNKERVLADCIAKIKKDNVTDRLSRLQDAIKAAHISKDDTLVTKLMGEYTELLKAGSARPGAGKAQ